MKSTLTPSVRQQLHEIVGPRCSDNESVRREHGTDESFLADALPEFVVYPNSTEEVVAIVNICRDNEVPLIPFGVGSSVEGHVLAIHGGVSLDTSRMSDVRAVHDEDLDVVVEPGITRETLNSNLERRGLFFSVDPGADASIGGMIATGASGTTSVRYGTMKDNVLALEVVLANGQVIRTGTRARKSSAGYDLTRLLVGSEGTLGVVTEATLRVHGIPEQIAAAVCSFETIGDAVTAVTELLQLGVPLARAELLDAAALHAINKHQETSFEATPTMFFELHGSDAAVHDAAETTEQICSSHGGGFRWEVGRRGRDHLWKARHEAYFATLALRSGSRALTTDVCVPISSLRACILETQNDLSDMPFPCTIVGHVGDGNFHVIVMVDPDDPEELRIASAFNDRLIERALSMGGTCTGEHGIGLGKKPYLLRELGSAVDVMKAIKLALDPQNVLNPGKVFD